MWDEKNRLAWCTAALGFDCLWSAEHHCNDYAFVPNNLQLLTYLTVRCPGVDLGIAAVIVPWHDPMRVAEQAAVLDMLSKGRLCLGPGAARVRCLPYQHGRVARALRCSGADDRERVAHWLH